MCQNGVDLGHTCIHCGKPLLSCWDDGPQISWHASSEDAEACMAELRAGKYEYDDQADAGVIQPPYEQAGTLAGITVVADERMPPGVLAIVSDEDCAVLRVDTDPR